MPYTLTEQEYSDVRLQIHANLQPDQLSDVQIGSDSMRGACGGVCAIAVPHIVDPEKLTTAQKRVIAALVDGTTDDPTEFIGTVLKSRQQKMFRRAVVFRTAGMCVPVVRTLTAEETGVVGQRMAVQMPDDKRADLFALAEAEIVLLHNVYGDDAFLPIEEPNNGCRYSR